MRLAATLLLAVASVRALDDPQLLADYTTLKKLLRDLNALGEVSGILQYDSQCFMPSGAATARAEQVAMLAKLQHNMATGPEMRAAVEALRADYSALPTAQMRANVRDAIEGFDQQALKSEALAEREARLEQEGYQAWQGAREASDWAAFAPKLEELVAVKREVASVTRSELVGRPGGELYDGAVDQFERGMTAQRIDELFAELRAGLLPLLEQILKQKRERPEIDAPHPALAAGPQWSVEDQEALAREVAVEMGYDFSKGRLDVSTHPFTGGAGPTDVRITTRFSEDWMECFSAVVHETGHALYEQGRDVSEEGRGLPSSTALSMGLHESQSLLWERMVLQSRPFWDFATPKFHERFPFTQSASADDFYRHYNRVQPGLIRVAADEVTYPLHVILRYEIERALFRGEMLVSDIPSVWNSRMKSDLGVDVPDDAHGALQDIHWSLGSFGYFPSYTLGAMASVQIFQAWIEQVQQGVPQDPGAPPVAYRMMQRGDFAALRQWLKQKVHEAGSTLASPDELLRQVTGSPLSPEPFLSYLRAKYSALYCIDAEAPAAGRRALTASSGTASSGTASSGTASSGTASSGTLSTSAAAATSGTASSGAPLARRALGNAIPFIVAFTSMTAAWCVLNNVDTSAHLPATPDASLPDESEEWLGSWREKIQLWWLATPYKKALESCTAALGLHLAERLDLATKIKESLGAAAAPPSAARPQTASEQQCEWIKSAELALPEFPEMPARDEANAPNQLRLLKELRKAILPIPGALLPNMGTTQLSPLKGAAPKGASGAAPKAGAGAHGAHPGLERDEVERWPKRPQLQEQLRSGGAAPARTAAAAAAGGVGGAALALGAAALALVCGLGPVTRDRRGRLALQQRPSAGGAPGGVGVMGNREA